MEIDVVIQMEPIEPGTEGRENCGAVVRFEGRVRPEEKGARISALTYEAYQPMAQAQIGKIVAELGLIHPCERVRIRHRVGHIPAGEIAILVEVFSRHRAEAFGMASQFMDRLKQDVPIWKTGAVG